MRGVSRALDLVGLVAFWLFMALMLWLTEEKEEAA